MLFAMPFQKVFLWCYSVGVKRDTASEQVQSENFGNWNISVTCKVVCTEKVGNTERCAYSPKWAKNVRLRFWYHWRIGASKWALSKNGIGNERCKTYRPFTGKVGVFYTLGWVSNVGERATYKLWVRSTYLVGICGICGVVGCIGYKESNCRRNCNSTRINGIARNRCVAHRKMT